MVPDLLPITFYLVTVFMDLTSKEDKQHVDI